MPWLARNVSSGNACWRMSAIAVGATVGDYVEIKAAAGSGNPSGFYRLIGVQGGYNFLIEMQPTLCRFIANGITSDITTGYTQPPVGTVFTLRFTKVSNSPHQWQASMNGVNFGAPFTNNVSATYNQIGLFANETTSAFRGDLYHVALSNNGGASATRFYDADASGGSGNILPDTAGGQNATQFGTWPADNSEWVFYSSGDTIASTVAWSITPIQWQGSAAVSAPTFSSTAAWSVGPMQWQGAANATPPVFNSVTAWSISPLQWQAAAAPTAPGAIASAVSWTISPLQWQATAQPAPVAQSSVAWSISPLNWQSTASATVPAFTASAAWSISPMQWQASAAATAPGATASTVNWSISPMLWQGSAAATVPTFNAAAAWTISPMVWQVSASIAGAPVFAAKGATITERFSSHAIIERLQTARIYE